MRDVRERVMQGSRKAFHAFKVVVVAVVCLLIGFSARHLFDAYGREKIPFLREKDMDAEVYVIAPAPQDTSLSPTPAEPHWN